MSPKRIGETRRASTTVPPRKARSRRIGVSPETQNLERQMPSSYCVPKGKKCSAIGNRYSILRSPEGPLFLAPRNIASGRPLRKQSIGTCRQPTTEARGPAPRENACDQAFHARRRNGFTREDSVKMPASARRPRAAPGPSPYANRSCAAAA